MSLKDFVQRGVVDRGQKQKRVEDFLAMVLREPGQRMFERDQNMMPRKRRVAVPGPIAGGPLGQLVLDTSRQFKDRRGDICTVVMLFVFDRFNQNRE